MKGLGTNETVVIEKAEFLPQTRNAVRALIFRGPLLLVQRKVYRNGVVRLTVPGGAPEIGETLEQGLRRECQEELGTEIVDITLMHVADYFKERVTIPPTIRHQIEFFFRCSVPVDYVAANGMRPDKHQQGVQWVDVNSESADLLFPQSLRPILKNDSGSAPVYLGLMD